jgi:hypothetical protein
MTSAGMPQTRSLFEMSNPSPDPSFDLPRRAVTAPLCRPPGSPGLRASPKSRHHRRAVSHESGVQSASTMLRNICSGELMKEQVVPPAFQLPDSIAEVDEGSPPRIQHKTLDMESLSGPSSTATSRPETAVRAPLPGTFELSIPSPVSVPVSVPVSAPIAHPASLTVSIPSPLCIPMPNPLSIAGSLSIPTSNIAPYQPPQVQIQSPASQEAMDLNKNLPELPAYLVPKPLFSKTPDVPREGLLRLSSLGLSFDRSRFSEWTVYAGSETDESDFEGGDGRSSTFSDVFESGSTSPMFSSSPLKEASARQEERVQFSATITEIPIPALTPALTPDITGNEVSQMDKLLHEFNYLGAALI